MEKVLSGDVISSMEMVCQWLCYFEADVLANAYAFISEIRMKFVIICYLK